MMNSLDMETMYPLVIDDFLTNDEVATITQLLDPRLRPNPSVGVRVALGFQNSEMAASAGVFSPAIPDVAPEDTTPEVALLGNIYYRVRVALEESFSELMSMVNCTYQSLTTGAFNTLHADDRRLDGTSYQEDGSPEELEWSALIYLSTYGEDFTGGSIVFPKQKLEIFPVKGQLVIFKGDLDYIHEVLEVTSGVRKNLVFFYGRRGNTSNKAKFEYGEVQ
jgi:hypothetical protein